MGEKWLAVVLVVLYLAGCGDSDHRRHAGEESKRALITQFLQEKMDRHDIPGLVLAVDLPETGPLNIALGVSEMADNTPMRGDERFRIGSASKSFTAIIVHQLAQEGKLALADSVEKWLPELLPDGAAITIGQLLNHTAGVPNFSAEDAWLFPYVLDPETEWTDADLIGLIKELPRANAPGEDFFYSNSHYVLLGMIIEAVTGNGWQAETESRFADLGLKSLHIPAGPRVESAAMGYMNWREWLEMDDDIIPAGLVARPAIHPSFVGAAGILAADMDDAMRWVEAVVEGELLNEAGQQALLDWFDIPDMTIQVGRGVVHEPDWQLIGHRGQIAGYDCSLQYRYGQLDNLTDGVPMAICINRSLAHVANASDINGLVLYDLLDLLFGTPETAAVSTHGAGERSRSAGRLLDSGF
ncbi:MAG: serine hydrolase domain-containing protein [Desulfuromonadales bacterium]